MGLGRRDQDYHRAATMLGDDVALKRDNALPCRTRSLSIVRRSGRALKVRVGSTSTKLIVSRTSPLSLRNSPSKRFLEGVLKGRLIHLNGPHRPAVPGS